jgi:hypothetical protein
MIPSDRENEGVGTCLTNEVCPLDFHGVTTPSHARRPGLLADRMTRPREHTRF